MSTLNLPGFRKRIFNQTLRAGVLVARQILHLESLVRFQGPPP